MSPLGLAQHSGCHQTPELCQLPVSQGKQTSHGTQEPFCRSQGKLSGLERAGTPASVRTGGAQGDFERADSS